MNVWVTFLPYTRYVHLNMALFGQPAHENVYRSRIEFLFDVDFGMKDIQLDGYEPLSVMEAFYVTRCRCTMFMFSTADFKSFIPYQTSNLEKNKLFKYEKPSWSS